MVHPHFLTMTATLSSSSWSRTVYRLLAATYVVGLLTFSTGFVAQQQHNRYSRSLPSSSLQTCKIRTVTQVGTKSTTGEENAFPKDKLGRSVIFFGDERDGMDRRHAMRAIMGSSLGVASSITLFPDVANAVYGSDAKMSFPDPIQSLADRAGKQCLVESLGTRECLVYREDEEKLLYKGADASSLLIRVQEAAQALERDIPPLVESKKWTQLTGVLTGPMGQLSSTMALLEKLAKNPGVAKQNAQSVKQDIFAMGTAVTNKQGDAVLKYRSLALEDLAIFLKGL